MKPKIESIEEYLKRGGEIKKVEPNKLEREYRWTYRLNRKIKEIKKGA